MNKLIKLGLVSLLALPIVGCAKQEKLVSQNKENTAETTTEAPKQKEKDTSKFDIFAQKNYEEFKFNASGAEYQGKLVDENGNRIMGDNGNPVGPNVQHFDYDVSVKLPTNYTVNAIVVDKNGHISDKYRLNKEVEERDHYWDEEYKKSTDELNNDYVGKIVATGFEKDHDIYSYDKLIFMCTFLPKNFEFKERGDTLEKVDSYYLEFDKKESLMKSDYKGYTLYTNKVDTDDGGYIECFLYLDNMNKVSFTYYNKYENTKDMTKEDANKKVIEFLDNYVTIKKR